MSADLIVAIDAGTQSMRAALVDFSGEIHHLVKTPIEPYFAEQPGYAEQRPEYYWEMLCLTTRQLLEESGISAERILAATVTTQRVTMINVDRDGKPCGRRSSGWTSARPTSTRCCRGSPCRCSRRRRSIRWSSTPRSTAGRTGSSRTSPTSGSARTNSCSCPAT